MSGATGSPSCSTPTKIGCTGSPGGSPASYPSTLESALIAKRAVWAALDHLHPRRRAIVVMHEIEGMSHRAVAACLGVSAMTVRWHLSMARRELKPILAAHMGGAR